MQQLKGYSDDEKKNNNILKQFIQKVTRRFQYFLEVRLKDIQVPEEDQNDEEGSTEQVEKLELNEDITQTKYDSCKSISKFLFKGNSFFNCFKVMKYNEASTETNKEYDTIHIHDTVKKVCLDFKLEEFSTNKFVVKHFHHLTQKFKEFNVKQNIFTLFPESKIKVSYIQFDKNAICNIIAFNYSSAKLFTKRKLEETEIVSTKKKRIVEIPQGPTFSTKHLQPQVTKVPISPGPILTPQTFPTKQSFQRLPKDHVPKSKVPKWWNKYTSDCETHKFWIQLFFKGEKSFKRKLHDGEVLSKTSIEKQGVLIRSIRTDGVSVTVLFSKYHRLKKIQDYSDKDEWLEKKRKHLKEIFQKNPSIIGVDPGRVRLISCVEIKDFSGQKPLKETKSKSDEKTFDLNSKEANIKLVQFRKWENKKKVKEKIKDVLENWPSKKTDKDQYLKHFWEHYKKLYEFYSSKPHLNWNFRMYRWKQQLMEKVVKKFSKETVCAFGATNKQIYSPIIRRKYFEFHSLHKIVT